MPTEISQSPRGTVGRLMPGIIFLVLAAVTGAVWHQEVSARRHMLQRHTEDVTSQGMRRLAMFVDFRLTATKLFARRWATHGARDFSRQRFEEFSRAFMAELPGTRAVNLIRPDLGGGWWVSATDQRDSPPLSPGLRSLLQRARADKKVVLSGPQRGERLIHVAAVSARRDGEVVGFIVVELDTAMLIDSCLLKRIRSEFNFSIDDGGERIYTQGDLRSGSGGVRGTASEAIANRVWSMHVTPISEEAQYYWVSSLPVPLLGLVLSVALALVVQQLSRRIELYRAARDHALREIEQREQAESALRASEARYRSIFDSTSDGFLVISHDGRIIDANRATELMHGYQVAEVRGRPLAELLATTGSTETLEVLRILAERGPVRFESQNRRKDGSTFDVEMRGTQLVYGDAPAILATITDVSERRRSVQRHALLARKVLVAQEDERARIARELHDELGQLLTALRLELDWVRKRSARGAAEGSIGFDNAFELVEKAAAELRRICRGLRPPLLDDLGVDPAVRLLVNEFKERTALVTTLALHMGEGCEVPSEVALCVYRILQESLTNVSRHSGASKVTIQLSCSPTELVLKVSDDGKGFDPAELTTGGSGLAGMRERANLVNGKLDITSERGKGTRVDLNVPLSAPHGKEVG